MRRAIEYRERPQQLADRCARGGALCAARSSPAIPYRSIAFFVQELPIPPLNLMCSGCYKVDDSYRASADAPFWWTFTAKLEAFTSRAAQKRFS